jgi:hypothetical protein
MGVNTNNQATKVKPDQSKAPKLRFTLGNSERYYEPAQYLSAMTVDKVVALFNNPIMSLEETEGKSLKVMYKTDAEVKFCGFVTAGDASIVLDESDVAGILESAQTGEIKKAISASELIDLF